MTSYCYVKSRPKPVEKWWRFLPFFFLAGGVILLANVSLPILFYQYQSRAKFSPQLLVPTSQANSRVLWKETQDDYRRPNTWFPAAPELPPRPSKATHYSLSIPSLKINEAVVEIGGEDLMEAMVHYSGTALPGRYGNAVIFCHSSLPQFFSPTNYKTICSTLPKIEIGDEILVNFDGIVYRYQVIKLVEVEPKDITVLAQYYDSQYLSLITCVPPGTYLRRLIVRAKLTS